MVLSSCTRSVVVYIVWVQNGAKAFLPTLGGSTFIPTKGIVDIHVTCITVRKSVLGVVG